jgi:putative chitinase
MLITAPQLIAAGISPTQAKLFADPLSAACALYNISTPLRIAALVAQCRVESGGFAHLEEDLYYRDAERVANLFRTAFDANRDGKISPEEIKAAVPYVRNAKALASKAYANRFGNGNEASGDGWLYRGRGLIGTTFKANYQAAEKAIGRPYTAQPDLLAQPTDACLTACHYFASRDCNAMADVGNIMGITRAINPGMAAADERAQNFFEARRAFA